MIDHGQGTVLKDLILGTILAEYSAEFEFSGFLSLLYV
jgi:hypothetical protein